MVYKCPSLYTYGLQLNLVSECGITAHSSIAERNIHHRMHSYELALLLVFAWAIEYTEAVTITFLQSVSTRRWLIKHYNLLPLNEINDCIIIKFSSREPHLIIVCRWLKQSMSIDVSLLSCYSSIWLSLHLQLRQLFTIFTGEASKQLSANRRQNRQHNER